MPEFITVASADQVPPGKGCLVRVGQNSIALFQVDGQYYAIEGLCPHRGGPLAEGWVEDGRVYCPLHGWQFEIASGNCLGRPEKAVHSFPLRVVDGQIQVRLNSNSNHTLIPQPNPPL